MIMALKASCLKSNLSSFKGIYKYVNRTCMFSMKKPQFLNVGNDEIAYHQINPDLGLSNENRPGLLYCPGFQSNMEGVKALALENYCINKNLPFVRFDYKGCGQSSGDIREVLFSDWKANVLAVLDSLTAGPQILIGSSIGAWLAIIAAKERPNRIHSFVGISSSPDFGHHMFKGFSPEILKTINEKGETIVETDHGNYVITKAFIEDSMKHFVMAKKKITLPCPTRLLHGMQDEVVSYQVSFDLAEKLTSKDLRVLLRKQGNHRLSQPEDVQVLFETLDNLIQPSDQSRILAINSWTAFSYYSHPERRDFNAI